MALNRNRVAYLKQGTKKSASTTGMSTMRIAVAGTGGLARLIAHYINVETTHSVVFLSRTIQQQLTDNGHQVAVVDYENPNTLGFALRGIDTVISTVTGSNQIELIKAAVAVHVRRFIPAEFEGSPSRRDGTNPLDRGRTIAQQWLSYHSRVIQSTSIVCGIFYERFGPGGLATAHISLPGLDGEGDYMMNCRNMSAEVPAVTEDNSETMICISAIQDVASLVTKALDMQSWPAELKMYGHRISVRDLVAAVQQLRGQEFQPRIMHTPDSLQVAYQQARAHGDHRSALRTLTLINTAAGYYEFEGPNLNHEFPDFAPINFNTWFRAIWAAELP